MLVRVGVSGGAIRTMTSEACSRRNEAGAVCDAAEVCGIAYADDALHGRDWGGTTSVSSSQCLLMSACCLLTVPRKRAAMASCA